MTSIDDIPAEVRWEIAAKAASALPLVYDMFFRPAVGQKYDEIETPIWEQGGRDIKSIATSLNLPTENAAEISSTLSIISTILFGPEWRFEYMTMGDRVVERIKGCPMFNRAQELGLDPKVSLRSACEVFTRSAVENLNPKYVLRHKQTMCEGYPCCESTLERR